MFKTLAQIRDQIIHQIIREEIESYITGKKKQRRCAYTGKLFTPKHRYHFFINGEARKNYYRGQFKPRD